MSIKEVLSKFSIARLHLTRSAISERREAFKTGNNGVQVRNRLRKIIFSRSFYVGNKNQKCWKNVFSSFPKCFLFISPLLVRYVIPICAWAPDENENERKRDSRESCSHSSDSTESKMWQSEKKSSKIYIYFNHLQFGTKLSLFILGIVFFSNTRWPK